MNSNRLVHWFTDFGWALATSSCLWQHSEFPSLMTSSCQYQFLAANVGSNILKLQHFLICRTRTMPWPAISVSPIRIMAKGSSSQGKNLQKHTFGPTLKLTLMQLLGLVVQTLLISGALLAGLAKLQGCGSGWQRVSSTSILLSPMSQKVIESLERLQGPVPAFQGKLG